MHIEILVRPNENLEHVMIRKGTTLNQIASSYFGSEWALTHKLIVNGVVDPYAGAKADQGYTVEFKERDTKFQLDEKVEFTYLDGKTVQFYLDEVSENGTHVYVRQIDPITGYQYTNKESRLSIKIDDLRKLSEEKKTYTIKLKFSDKPGLEFMDGLKAITTDPYKKGGYVEAKIIDLPAGTTIPTSMVKSQVAKTILLCKSEFEVLGITGEEPVFSVGEMVEVTTDTSVYAKSLEHRKAAYLVKEIRLNEDSEKIEYKLERPALFIETQISPTGFNPNSNDWIEEEHLRKSLFDPYARLTPVAYNDGLHTQVRNNKEQGFGYISNKNKGDDDQVAIFIVTDNEGNMVNAERIVSINDIYNVKGLVSGSAVKIPLAYRDSINVRTGKQIFALSSKEEKLIQLRNIASSRGKILKTMEGEEEKLWWLTGAKPGHFQATALPLGSTKETVREFLHGYHKATTTIELKDATLVADHTQVLKEGDWIMLIADVPDYGLEVGDIKTVKLVHPNGMLQYNQDDSSETCEQLYQDEYIKIEKTEADIEVDDLEDLKRIFQNLHGPYIVPTAEWVRRVGAFNSFIRANAQNEEARAFLEKIKEKKFGTSHIEVEHPTTGKTISRPVYYIYELHADKL